MTDLTDIRLIPPTRSNGVRWTARRGAVSDTFDPDKLADMRRLARVLEVPLAEWQTYVAQARVEFENREVTVDAPAPATAVPVHSWNEPRPGQPHVAGRETFPDLDTALARSPFDLFAWEGTDHLAALDFDVQPGKGFDDAEVARWVTMAAAPLPYVGWRTKSNGLRLIFKSTPASTARGRAALFLLLTDLARDDRLLRVEILPRTRRPPLGNRVVYSDADAGVPDLRGRLLALGGEAACTLDEIQAWLEEHGLGYGRHPHERCPIDPGPHGQRDPVWVGEDGILCHRCDGVHGSGWRSWAALVGKVEVGARDPLAQLATGWVHWTHAKYVLRATFPVVPDGLLRAGYDALFGLVYPEEEHVERRSKVFDPTLAFVRGENCWLRESDWAPHDTIGQGSLRALPWVDGSPTRVEFAMGTGRLSGYVPLTPIAHLIQAPEWENRYSILVPRPVEAASDDPPLSWEELRAELSTVFEGAPESWHAYVLALVVGAIRAQRGGATPPITILHGNPGSGKGAAVALAEGALGTQRAGINLSREAQDVAISIGMGLEAGAMILFGDELGKTRDFWAKSGPLLALCDTHTWRKLYAGQVTTKVRAHVVLACSTLPRGLTTMPEFDRRVAVLILPSVDLGLSSRWESNVAKFWGVPSLSALRSSPRGAQVAKGLVNAARALAVEGASEPWGPFAAQFGATALRDDDDARFMHDVVRGLYDLWTGPDKSVFSTVIDRMPGWLRCYRTSSIAHAPEDEAARVMEGWVDPEDPPDERTAKLYRLETANCRAVLNVNADVRLLVRSRGRKLWVKFKGDK